MSKTDFHSTPDYRVVSTFATQTDVDALLKELLAAGFKDDGINIGVHHGEEGKEFIDPDGSRHGFFARLTRTIQRLPSWEASMLEQIEYALNNDQYVVGVFTGSSKQQRLTVGKIMGKHTQQRIYYRGSHSMEILREAIETSDSGVSQQAVLIEPHAVTVEAAPDFLRQWQRESSAASKNQGFIQARLNQSVQVEPQYRFVNMARWTNTTTFLSQSPTPNLYRQIVEQVGNEAEYQEYVIVISFIEATPDSADAFAEKWAEMSDSVAQMDGFIWATLYRAIDPEARYQFVNYAQWHSADTHAAFTQTKMDLPGGIAIHSGTYRVALAVEKTS